jgi:Flp pilus assembly protein TadG
VTADQRGAAAVELALIVPVVVLLFGVVVGGARVWLARADVEQMAGAAARAGSQARTPAAAVVAATDLAHAQATTAGLRCRRLSVDVDARSLASPPGTPAEVLVTVRCGVPLEDVIVPGWPGELTLTAAVSSVVDSYRGRR